MLRLGALGDVVFLLPAISALHKRWPDAEIHWLIKKPYAPLIQDHPAISKIWSFGKGIPEIFRMGSLLRKQRYDLVLDYHANLRSGLLSWLSRSPLRVGFARPFNKEGNSIFNHERLSPPSLKDHKIDRNMFLTNAVLGGAPEAPISKELATSEHILRSFDEQRKEFRDPLVVVHAGTSPKGEIKRWFEDRYASVIERVLKESSGSVLLLWGSDRELELAKQIKTLAGSSDRIWVPEHRFSFPDILALYKRAACYLGVDSGPMHLANAFGLPLVALYGPKSLDIYRPYFEGATVLSKNSEVGCPPCNATNCHNPKGRVCLEALNVEEVAQAVLQVVNRDV